MSDPAPIIVTALFGDADFAWLDGLRRLYFPPERNIVPAHLTLFHHIMPTLENELVRRLKQETDDTPPPVRITGLIRLGGGVAFRVESEGLGKLRARLADAFAGTLTRQDASGWRPHVTIQNKAPAAEAALVYETMQAGFAPRPLAIVGLAAWRYRGGPWQNIGRYPFRRFGRSHRN